MAEFECKMCADPIGTGEKKNIVWMCDRRSGEWCGKCFGLTACGYGKHGEGCPTQMICTSRGEIQRAS